MGKRTELHSKKEEKKKTKVMKECGGGGDSDGSGKERYRT